MQHTKDFSQSDGSTIRIQAFLHELDTTKLTWRFKILKREKGKRTFTDYKLNQDFYSAYVLVTKLELWHKIKP